MTEYTSTYDLIVGLGRCGLSMARFLKSRGHEVKATDIDSGCTDAAAELEALGIETLIGSHDQALFDNAARIIPSPGVPLTLPHIIKAQAKGVTVTGELDIFSRHNHTPVIAVTGSNGKTTTTTLIADLLRHCGISCFVGGNIGTPLMDYLATKQAEEFVVAEVSSFQLDLAHTFCPDIALLLNITEDHLDRYASFDAYADSKWSIFSRQTAGQTAIINREIQDVSPKIRGISSDVLMFSSRQEAQATVTPRGIDIRTPKVTGTVPQASLDRFIGVHNKENAAAAVLAALSVGADLKDICEALENFTPLPHRVTWVRELDGIRFYDDSKATNVDAVIRAMESFDTKIILILGGREKDTDFTPLVPHVAARVQEIMAIGEASAHVCATFAATCPVMACSGMDQAVEQAFGAASEGHVVLLSPACASFDMYEGYAARGDDFIRCVKGLESKKGAHNG